MNTSDFLLMALAGLSRDPNAGMNALKGYTTIQELEAKRRQEEEARQSQASGNQINAASLEYLKNKIAEKNALQGFESKKNAIGAMPDQVELGGEAYSVPGPNTEKEAALSGLQAEFSKYRQAAIHPADAFISVIKNNPNAPVDVAAKAVGLIYQMDQNETNKMAELSKMILGQKLKTQGDIEVEQEKGRIKSQEPQKMGSDIGKRLQDREGLVAKYGEGSPQVKAFDADYENTKVKEGKNSSLYNDFATGYKAELKKKFPNMTDEQISLLTATEAERRKLTGQTQVGVTVAQARSEGFGNIREYPAIDTKNNNSLVYLNANELNKANKADPGRFIPAGEGRQALNKTALVEDIRGNIDATRKSINNLKTDFTAAQRVLISYVLKSSDPKSAVSSFMQGSAASTLTPDQMEYVTDLFQLHENAMAMRSVLGAGQGSDELRAAIRATVPGGNTPSKAYGKMQLDKFENVINRLSRGIPNVPLRKDLSTDVGNNPPTSLTPTHKYIPGKGLVPVGGQ